MLRYPFNYNPILEYWNKIEEGQEVVSIKVYKVYKEIVRIIHDSDSEWEYDSKKGNHVIEFIENYCKHSKGKLGGKPFILELWQKSLVATTFGIVHKIDGTRKYQEVMLVVARKNGKSTLASSIGLYMMIADGEPGAEIFAVATKKDQAKIIWSEAKRMVKKSPSLLRRIKPLVADMVSSFNDSSFRPLGSDSNTQDGLNVHCALLDEIHAWKSKDLYDVIVDGTSSRDEPLIFITSTAGTVRESIFDIKYEEAEMLLNGYEDENGYKDETFLPIIYELDNKKEWLEPLAYKKANPGLGTIKKIEQLEKKVNKAKSNSLLVKNLLTKDFNIRETSSETWLMFDELNNKTKFNVADLRPNYGIGGTDLSKTTDLTAAVVIFMCGNDENIYVLSMAWLPHDLLEERSKEDRIPYNLWYEQGLIRTCPGNKVHPKYVTEWFLEVREQYGIYLPWVGYDAWSAAYWVEEMEGYFGKEAMEKVHQGKKTLSSPMYQLKADLKSKIVNYNNNPIMKWCLSNMAIDIDKNENIQPCKTNNRRKRIDLAAALLNAYTTLKNHDTEYQNMI
ncbi:TPA: terminase large subunit [Clostridioides difficile]|uniref:terminase large subunit n=1 Tax=Clostridioides difficile TaxID=1496 RepID=UPI00038CFCCA|nr:terminase TerL endonuclease subunit [Clostridioides difficile]EQJ93901.1 phage Terminase family protein [Clostridioides difficile P51]MDO0459754.1 terminase large subunit [Clostridioides difficile]HBF1697473.1 terminase large subunit [Clostridioides difficile]HBF3265493.1 terminase large subunit [Clostridioides difficile]HBG0928052.1 terminase large subunit [Clostridioides difficile]